MAQLGRPEGEEERRNALFALLTEEIKDLNEAHKQEGWTPWILVATLISMAWLVLQVQLRVMAASSVVKSSAIEEEKLVAEIKQFQGPADEEQLKFAREFHEIQDTWNRMYPDEIREHEPFGISRKSLELGLHT